LSLCHCVQCSVYCHYVILFNALYIVIMSFRSMFCILSLCHSVQCSVYCHYVILFDTLYIVIMSFCSMFCILSLCHFVQCSVYCHYVILCNFCILSLCHSVQCFVHCHYVILFNVLFWRTIWHFPRFWRQLKGKLTLNISIWMSFLWAFKTRWLPEVIRLIFLSFKFESSWDNSFIEFNFMYDNVISYSYCSIDSVYVSYTAQLGWPYLTRTT